MSSSIANPNAPDTYEDWPDHMKHAAAVTPKETTKYIFFFGHIGPSTTLNCLSPWHPAPFQDSKGNKFATFEHYMMYSKAILMKDGSTAAKVIHPDTTAKQAKALGREVQNYDGKLWKENRDEVVFRGNLLKFEQNEVCQKTLLATDDQKPFVEASPEDKIWGIGYPADEAEGNEEEWGLNLMGKALTKVRERLSSEKRKGDDVPR